LINSDLSAFIRSAIPSVWAVEILILLRREPGRRWTADALVQEMRASNTLVGEVLAVFNAAGLVRREDDDSHVYDPTEALGLLADQLETAYRERPAAVVKAILSSPNDKLQSFADAFRFRGD
jgi:hypothetical protein